MSFFTYQDILGRKSDLVRAYLDALTIALEKKLDKKPKIHVYGKSKNYSSFLCVINI